MQNISTNQELSIQEKELKIIEAVMSIPGDNWNQAPDNRGFLALYKGLPVTLYKRYFPILGEWWVLKIKSFKYYGTELKIFAQLVDDHIKSKKSQINYYEKNIEVIDSIIENWKL